MMDGRVWEQGGRGAREVDDEVDDDSIESSRGRRERRGEAIQSLWIVE